MNCPRCGEPYALGWWCNACKWTTSGGELWRADDEDAKGNALGCLIALVLLTVGVPLILTVAALLPR